MEPDFSLEMTNLKRKIDFDEYENCSNKRQSCNSNISFLHGRHISSLTLNDLPEEILILIVAHLSADLSSFSLVNKKFRKISFPLKIQECLLDPCRRIGFARVCDLIDKSPKLKKLNLGSYKFSVKHFQMLTTKCTALESLVLWKCDIGSKFIVQLSALSSLKNLALVSCKMGPESSFHHLTSLTSLDLDSSLNTQDLTVPTTLKSLTLWTASISDIGLDHLSDLKELTKLSLSLCRNVTDKGLSVLQRFTQLRKLNLSGTSIRGVWIGKYSQSHTTKFS